MFVFVAATSSSNPKIDLSHFLKSPIVVYTLEDGQPHNYIFYRTFQADPPLPKDSPEIYVRNAATDLATACTSLFNKIKANADLAHSFKLELIFQDSRNSGNLQIYLNPMCWLQYNKAISNSIEQTLTAAEEWVAKFPLQLVPVCKQTDNYKRTCSSDNCRHIDDEHKKKFVHKANNLICKKMVAYGERSEEKRECSQTLYKENLIDLNDYLNPKVLEATLLKKMKLFQSDWILAVRPELSRELLIHVRPDTRNSIHTNEEGVCSADFWEMAQWACLFLDTAQFLINKNSLPAVTRIVFNMGRWQTAIVRDPRLRECHMHSHLWLSTYFVDLLYSKLLENNDMSAVFARTFQPLNMHDIQPEEYMASDALSLTSHYIIPHRFDEIKKNMVTKADLEASLENFKDLETTWKTFTEKIVTKLDLETILVNFNKQMVTNSDFKSNLGNFKKQMLTKLYLETTLETFKKKMVTKSDLEARLMNFKNKMVTISRVEAMLDEHFNNRIVTKLYLEANLNTFKEKMVTKSDLEMSQKDLLKKFNVLLIFVVSIFIYIFFLDVNWKFYFKYPLYVFTNNTL